MSKKIAKFLRIAVPILLALASLVLITKVIAANASDDFSSYTDEADLNGGAGGSGWGANTWLTIASHTTLKAEATACQVANCVDAQLTNADHGNDRTLSAGITSGDITYYAKQDESLNHNANHFLRTWDSSQTNEHFGVGLLRTGGGGPDIVARRSGGNTDVGDWIDDTWHKIEISFGANGSQACGANKFAVSVDDGAYSACLDYINTGDVINISLQYTGGDGTVSGMFDELTIVDASGGAAAATTPIDTFFIDF